MRNVFYLLLVSFIISGCVIEQTISNDEDVNIRWGPKEVFIQGADLPGANGMHFGPDGMLYVATVNGSSVIAIDPKSGDIVKRMTMKDGVIGPDDVAFASDGSYYWTSILTGEVAGFTAQGEKVIAAQLPPGPNPITFSTDDRLFVAQCFLGTYVYELDMKGVKEPRIIADDLGPGCGLNGMDWGPDDRLYGPRWFVGEIISIDVDTGNRRVEVKGFKTPAAVKFDSQGRLYVLDTGKGDITRVTDDGKDVIATLEPGLDNFAFDVDDNLFISSYMDGFVKRMEPDGSFTTLLRGGVTRPGGIAVIGDVVWLADLHALRAFDRATGHELLTQRNIVGISEMGGAINLSVDGENLILSSWLDGSVRVWDPGMEILLEHYPGLAYPVAAVRYSGGVAIAEHGNGSVKLYGGNEDVLYVENLPAPSGLFVKDDELYVSDRTLGQILQIASNGQVLKEPRVVADGLSGPEGFLLLNEGLVVVEDESAQLVFIDSSGYRRPLLELQSGSPGMPGLPPSQIFNGVAIDQQGVLYVPEETTRTIYRMGLLGDR